MEFEWDEVKRHATIAKHGIDFLRARQLFDGRATVSFRSSYPDEERWLTTGIIDERCVTVVWTRRGAAIRLISAGGHMMQKNARTMRYTTQELDEQIAQGHDLTDWARFDAMTEAELSASIDHDEEGEIDWSTIQIGIPGPKQQLTVRFDLDVIDWFKAQGPGYQTRMNAVLKSFVDAQKKSATSRR